MPALFTPVVYIVGRKIGKHVGWVALIPLAYVVLLFTSLLPDVIQGRPRVEKFVWISDVIFGLLIDGLSLPIVLVVAILSAVIVIYSIPYMEHRIRAERGAEDKRAHATYYALYLLYAVSMMGVALATNLFEFYLFYELMVVPSWALINAYGYGEREKISLMYLLWTIAGAVLLLTGILVAHARIHSFEISDLTLLAGDPLAFWIVLVMLLGFSVKMAMFGLHIWLPYAHAEAPTPISALLSPAMIGLAAYGTVRLLTPISGAFGNVGLLALPWALITIVYGGLMVMAQHDIKRLLAYSSISQMGYLLTGIASYTTLGVSGAMLHYISHGLGKATLFLVAGAIIHQTGIRDIRQLGGLAARMPISATTFIIGFMNIAGVPPTVGFMSKWFVFAGAFKQGIQISPLQLTVALSAMISTILTVVYAFWTIRRIFHGPLPAHLQNVKEAPATLTIPLLLFSALSLILGIYPGAVLAPLVQAIGSWVPS